MLLKDNTFTHLADLFSALSDPTRLRIISALLEGELNVGDIATQLEMTEFSRFSSTSWTAPAASGAKPQGWPPGLLYAR